MAAKYGIYENEVEVHCWPDENLATILDNLRSVVEPCHQVIVVFGLTFEAWNYVPLLENQSEPRIVFPNPNFSLDSVAQSMDEFVLFCKQINPNVKVILTIPTVQDMFVYNKSRVHKHGKHLLPMLNSSPTFNKEAMAQNSRLVYRKLMKLSHKEYNWTDMHTFTCQNVLNRIIRTRKRKSITPTNLYLYGISDLLNVPTVLQDGLHPTKNFIIRFWDKYNYFYRRSESDDMVQEAGPPPQIQAQIMQPAQFHPVGMPQFPSFQPPEMQHLPFQPEMQMPQPPPFQPPPEMHHPLFPLQQPQPPAPPPPPPFHSIMPQPQTILGPPAGPGFIPSLMNQPSGPNYNPDSDGNIPSLLSISELATGPEEEYVSLASFFFIFVLPLLRKKFHLLLCPKLFVNKISLFL